MYMNLYVVRHGQTDFNKEKIYQGRKDVPLNKLGKEQAQNTAYKLRQILGEKKLDVLFVSPLQRAMQTAEPIAELFNIEPIVCPEIIERSFGNLEGHSPNNSYTNEMMLNFEKNYNKENVEPVKDLFKRVYDWLNSIIETYSKIEEESKSELNILVTTHGAVTIAIECYMHGEPRVMNFNTLEPLASKNAEIRIYEKVPKTRRYINIVNEEDIVLL